MRLLTLTLALLLRAASAIFADEAGSVDYHLALLGQPGNSSTFFHQPVPGSKASLVYTLSERNVLGAINPKDGSVVWRHLLANNASVPQGHLSTAEGQELLYTTVNDTASAWSASGGRFAWDLRHEGALVKDVETLNIDEGRNGKVNGDAVALWAGKNGVVQRIDADTGVVAWTYEYSSGISPHRVAASAGEVFVVGLSKAMLGGNKLHVSVVDAGSGKAKDQVTLSSESEISSEQDILYIGHVGSIPMAIWTDASKSVIKTNVLGSKNIGSFDVGSTAEPVIKASIQTARTKNGPAHFLVELRSSKAHWAQVFHVDAKSADVKKAKVSKAYDLPKLEDKGTFASSAVDNDVYFVRIASEIQIFSSASHGVLARWPLKLSSDIVGHVKDWHPVHAASEVVARADSTYAVRSAVLRDTGDWVLVRNGDAQWTRPEQLSTITNAGWIETNQSQPLVDELEAEVQVDPVSAFLHRAKRHITHAADMPTLIEVLPDVLTRWVRSFLQNGHSKERAFGFDKVLYALLDNGKIVSVDSDHPQRVRTLGEGDLKEAQQVRDSLDALVASEPQGVYSYKVDDTGLSGFGPGDNVWHFSLPKGQEILKTVAQPAGEKIASIGKVLGDRNVLYKYLNPNAVLVLVKDENEHQLSAYVLDVISGAVLHSEDHDDVDLSHPVCGAITENWFTYSFTFDSSKDSLSRGHLLVMGEAYESEFPNDRGPMGASGNFSAIDPSLAIPGSIKPHVVSQVYHIPEEISHMAITQTQQGITSRQLLVTLANTNAVVGVPHQILDPRRPVGVAPTSQQMEEALMQYSPYIEFDPKMYLTHSNEVLGINKVISAPSDMESTSLVFAYGLDVFGTRVAPSFTFDILGASFNKIQLILTVIALTIGVFAVGPLIKRKQTNALWQS